MESLDYANDGALDRQFPVSLFALLIQLLSEQGHMPPYHQYLVQYLPLLLSYGLDLQVGK